MSTPYEQMKSGEIYWPSDTSLMEQQFDCLEKLYDFNATRPHEQESGRRCSGRCWPKSARTATSSRHCARTGAVITCISQSVYANFNLTIVDDCDIYIGDHTMIGPNVTIATANHPLAPELRERAYQYNLPVHIGKNVWLGAGVIVVPGVTIGDNTVIGAGSVVTRDIPANVLAFGVPCRVQRELGEQDWEYYYRGKRVPQELLKYRKPGKETEA